MRPQRFSINITLDGCYDHKAVISDAEYGRFAWVFDPEGNKVELWEPK
jgi:predicted enzyme related to lactoylglutathione lyase